MRHEPSFRVAQIVYFSDLTRPDARVVPLGSLAEIILPHMHGLALKARTTLMPDELRLVSPLVRDALANPFSFLRADFESAWESADGASALQFFAKRHASSLSVLAPVEYHQRHWLLERLLPVREEAVEGQLSSAVDSEFGKLLTRFGAHVSAQRKRIESEVREAA